MAYKILIFLGLVATALGFTPYEEQFNDVLLRQIVFGDPFEDEVIRFRKVRSPQGYLDAKVEHSDRQGTSANFKYTQPVTKNLDVYADAIRKFRYNDNVAHAGLSYRF